MASTELFCRKTLLGLHAAWVVWVCFWGLKMEEVRTSRLGAALLVAGVAVILGAGAAEFFRWRAGKNGKAEKEVRVGRPPRFGWHVWAGVIVMACASYGLVLCFYLDLPNAAMLHVTKMGGPLSRWVFLVGGVFGVTMIYGAAVVAIASGLVGRRAKEAEPQISQVSQTTNETETSVPSAESAKRPSLEL